MTNIKFSFKIEPVSLSTVANNCVRQKCSTAKFRNFIVVRPHSSICKGSNWVCTIFKKSSINSASHFQHVNVTNIRSKKEIPAVIDNLRNLGINAVSDTTSIDNVTGLMTVNKINIGDVIKNFTDKRADVSKTLDAKFGGSHELSIHYNNERFPGLFIKFYRDSSKIGTSIIFHTGKIVVVGCKSRKKLECLSQAVNVLISIKLLT